MMNQEKKKAKAMDDSSSESKHTAAVFTERTESVAPDCKCTYAPQQGLLKARVGKMSLHQADVLARMNQNLSRGLRAFDYHGTAPTSAVLVPLHRGTIAEPVAILQLYFPRNKFHVVNHGEVSSYYRELLQCHLIDFAFESDSIHLVLGDVALVCVASFLQEAREDTAVTTAALMGVLAGAGLGWLRSVPSATQIPSTDRHVNVFFGAAIGLVALPTVAVLFTSARLQLRKLIAYKASVQHAD